MSKEEITRELLLNFAGEMEDALVNNLIVKLEAELREQVAKEIENSFDPPPIDERDFLIWEVISRCADIARGHNEQR